MARNAQLERDLIATGECDAAAYDESAENRRFEAIAQRLANVERDLGVLVKVAGFNPKAPLSQNGASRG